jgi:hypothetical protein
MLKTMINSNGRCQMRVGAIQFLAGSDVHQCGSRISTAVTQYGGFAVHHSQLVRVSNHVN